MHYAATPSVMATLASPAAPLAPSAIAALGEYHCFGFNIRPNCVGFLPLEENLVFFILK